MGFTGPAAVPPAAMGSRVPVRGENRPPKPMAAMAKKAPETARTDRTTF